MTKIRKKKKTRDDQRMKKNTSMYIYGKRNNKRDS